MHILSDLIKLNKDPLCREIYQYITILKIFSLWTSKYLVFNKGVIQKHRQAGGACGNDLSTLEKSFFQQRYKNPMFYMNSSFKVGDISLYSVRVNYHLSIFIYNKNLNLATLYFCAGDYWVLCSCLDTFIYIQTETYGWSTVTYTLFIALRNLKYTMTIKYVFCSISKV